MDSKTIYTQAYRELVQRLRLRREALGLTQTDVAARLGWPQQRLSAVEAGARRLDIVEFIELTNQLDLPLVELIETLRTAVLAQGRR
ncbi:helix-turn-helix transcriptional regulator [Stenotrophomonas sp.]|uniref:helix-turn-helix domain-containing protein n=1 Tax=Stenotrophomonas sp. TaxID=69392 RepID=UPI0028AD9A0F|nr:helix-turn-helix transcriptional regulator [Stenotrophomonas sp.]